MVSLREKELANNFQDKLLKEKELLIAYIIKLYGESGFQYDKDKFLSATDFVFSIIFARAARLAPAMGALLIEQFQALEMVPFVEPPIAQTISKTETVVNATTTQGKQALVNIGAVFSYYCTRQLDETQSFWSLPKNALGFKKSVPTITLTWQREIEPRACAWCRDQKQFFDINNGLVPFARHSNCHCIKVRGER